MLYEVITVTEDEKQTVVMGAAWQPAHQPAAAFVPAKLRLDRLRVLVPVVPKGWVDQPHQMGIATAHPPSYNFV